ncbi:hypothetical protein IQ07DRAFT_153184 [Pyrenochaeta sp. DS3sAY3a]|nr:hypothetical protein IQ07DRAFT_153184 [Pyrenochaeta sp. DS3sAY3a]
MLFSMLLILCVLSQNYVKYEYLRIPRILKLGFGDILGLFYSLIYRKQFIKYSAQEFNSYNRVNSKVPSLSFHKHKNCDNTTSVDLTARKGSFPRRHICSRIRHYVACTLYPLPPNQNNVRIMLYPFNTTKHPL